MSTPEIPQDATSFAPTTDDPFTGTDALTELQNQIVGAPGELDLVVAPDPNYGQPLGRSWAFDFHGLDGASGGGFVKTPGSLSPQPTSDMETLRGWIVKCLNTARGAHPVHPPGYGVVAATQDLIAVPVGQVPSDLYERITDALTFHPRITACENFAYDFDPDDEAVSIAFTVLLDDDSELSFSRLGLAF